MYRQRRFVSERSLCVDLLQHPVARDSRFRARMIVLRVSDEYRRTVVERLSARVRFGATTFDVTLPKVLPSAAGCQIVHEATEHNLRFTLA